MNRMNDANGGDVKLVRRMIVEIVEIPRERVNNYFEIFNYESIRDARNP